MPRRSGCLLSLFGNDERESVRLPYDKNEGLLTQAERSFYCVLLEALDAMRLRVAVCPKVGLKDIFRVVAQDNKEYMSYMNKIDRKHVDFLLCEPHGMGLIAGVELDDSSHLSERGRARDVFVERVYAAAGLPLLRFRVQHAYDISDMVRYMRQELALMEMAAAMEDDGTVVNEKAAVIAETVFHTGPDVTGSREESAAAASPDTPQCPRCGAPMVLRKAHRGKRQGLHFWGCSRFPRCRCVVERKVNA